MENELILNLLTHFWIRWFVVKDRHVLFRTSERKGLKFQILMLYSHMLQLYTYTCRIYIDAMNKRREKTSLKKYTSHFIVKVCVWEGVRDRTELKYIVPHSYGHQRCVFLVLQGCSLLDDSPGLLRGCSPLLQGCSRAALGCSRAALGCSRAAPGLLSAAPGLLQGCSLLDDGFLYRILSLTHLSSNSDFLSHRVI